MKLFKVLLLFVICCITVSLTSCQEDVSFASGGSIVNNNHDDIIVDIKGAVAFPGVYTIKEGSLLIDVINLAGGLIENADIKNINFAMTLSSNQMIVIPVKTNLSDEIKENNLININTSDVDELTVLPGIGEVKAQNIIDYRNQNGMFTSVEQLKNVSGISESLFEKIKTLVTL